MEDYKEETKRAYNQYSEKFSKKFDLYFHTFVKKEADLFLQSLKGKKILDVGSGPGTHAAYFMEKGFDPFCIDISEAMIDLCKQKALRAEVMDIEHLELEETYDGIWAYTSLLHLPKNKISRVIKKIAGLLNHQGVFGLALKEGTGEGFEIKKDYPRTQRWFTYLEEKEVRKICEVDFEFLHLSKTHINQNIFVSYLFRKK